MKDLKTHLLESIKPPRLSAKNKELWKGATEAAIMKWLEENCNVTGKVDIVDGNINVEGTISISDDVEFFPYPFGEVTGYFCCSECRLKSLKNSPRKVSKFFDCSFCSILISLEGAPEEVGGNFYCNDCGKQFTEEDVKKVCNVKGKIYV